jgi:mono/diheme cytochrome c family protein
MTTLRLCILALLSIRCAYEAPPAFTEPLELGGEQVPAATLNAGQTAYTFYCVACHGRRGDGRGPAAAGLAVPPRDFRLATYKFAGVPPGTLPHDEDLARIVQHGLSGTAMLRWDVPAPVLRDILQYIKAFSPAKTGWRDPRMKRGERIVPLADPWAGDQAAAIARGAAVYHGVASCHGCHPAYAALPELNQHRAVFGMPPVDELRPQAWLSAPKPSESYSLPVLGDPVCKIDRDCATPGQLCRYGRCERQMALLPTDFTVHPVRTGADPKSLFRVIAAGIPGTAMPTWQGALPDRDLWALAHYVQHLASLRNTDRAYALKRQLGAGS